MIHGGAVALLAAPAAVLLVARAARTPIDWGRLSLQLLALAHVAGVAALTLFPLPVTSEQIAAGRNSVTFDHNIVPFATLRYQFGFGLRREEVVELIGNTVLLMPLAIYAPVLWPRTARALPFVGLAIGSAVAIELSQLAISTVLGYPYRVADIDDVIVNATGAVIAYGAWRLAAPPRA